MKKESSTKSSFSERLFQGRRAFARTIPSRTESQEFADRVLDLLFPQLSERSYHSASEIESELSRIEESLADIIQLFGKGADANATAKRIVERLPEIHRLLELDATAIYEGDPAAESLEEVIVAYPGFFAIAIYRLAHECYKANVPVFPRLIAEYAHQVTGIDINPGATIGESFFIDHGTGIVVGETSVIGRNVKLYQGVTLGALSVDKDLAKKKRHPTIEDDVVIYANATILGGDTVVGRGSVIGGNVWLTKSVPANSVVYQTSEVTIRDNANESE